MHRRSRKINWCVLGKNMVTERFAFCPVLQHFYATIRVLEELFFCGLCFLCKTELLHRRRIDQESPIEEGIDLGCDWSVIDRITGCHEDRRSVLAKGRGGQRAAISRAKCLSRERSGNKYLVVLVVEHKQAVFEGGIGKCAIRGGHLVLF